jgi:transcriptional regulator with GAF, ATPase, and Fis domain
VVNDETRNKRLRLLIRRFNKQRKQQAKQIDILCNDIISAHKDFLNAVKTIGFAADFYNAIAGITDLNELLGTAANSIQKHTPDIHVAFFLFAPSPVEELAPEGSEGTQADNFELHVFESEQEINLEEKRIENFFTSELVINIAKSNHICTIEDMLGMGLQCSPVLLEKISTAAIPLSTQGQSTGFVLIYRSSRKPFTVEDLKAIAQIAPGLARSISSCRALISSI